MMKNNEQSKRGIALLNIDNRSWKRIVFWVSSIIKASRMFRTEWNIISFFFSCNVASIVMPT